MVDQNYFNNLPECNVYEYDCFPILDGLLLWCGVDREMLDEIRKEVQSEDIIYRHPQIPCLERKSRVIDRAIRNGEVRAVREHGEGGEIEKDHNSNIILDYQGKPKIDLVAKHRRHFWLKDLKQYISDYHPQEKPKTLFSDDERKPILTLSEYQQKLLEAQNEITQLKIDLSIAESRARDFEEKAINAEERLEKGRNLYRQLQQQKSVNPDKMADVLKLMSLAINDLQKKGDNLTASGLNSYLHGLKAKIERETDQTIPYSIPDTKTLQNYLNN